MRGGSTGGGAARGMGLRVEAAAGGVRGVQTACVEAAGVLCLDGYFCGGVGLLHHVYHATCCVGWVWVSRLVRVLLKLDAAE